MTNAQFQEFVEATGYVTDAERIGRAEVWNPNVLSANRNYQAPDYSSNFVGFRCAWSKSILE